MSKLSVLMVVAKYPATHGHTTVINNLCHELNNMGHRAAIGAFSFDKEPPHNIEKIVLSKSKLLRYGVKYLDFDIIHTHQSRVNYYLLAVNPKKPIILHYHGASSWIQRLNFKLMMTLYKNKIKKIISVSGAGITQMKNMIGKVHADVLYNGVDTDFYSPELPVKYKKGDPQLLFVSALRRYKNTSMLIDAMPKLVQKYPNIHLQIVGTGEDYENLKQQIQKNHLEKNVELTGKISDEELRFRYSSCDLYVSASKFEVCPVPTLEAMSAAKPIVLFDIEPHKEIVDASGAGVIFSSIDDITEKIAHAYENRRSLSVAARKFAEDHSWKNICTKLVQMYQSVL